VSEIQCSSRTRQVSVANDYLNVVLVLQLCHKSFRMHGHWRYLPKFMDLSIIIPAFNEAGKIRHTCVNALTFIAKSDLQGELIIVDDGSTDGTADCIESRAAGTTRIIQHAVNEGKGSACRTGVLAARGKNILVVDCGPNVDFRYALDGLRLLQNGQSEIAHGSRRLPESQILIHPALHRRYLSFTFQKLIHLFFPLPRHLTDTQCGFKLYRAKTAKELFRPTFTKGFMIDIEIILRASAAGHSIIEFPVAWESDPESSISFRRHALQMCCELYKIRRALLVSPQL